MNIVLDLLVVAIIVLLVYGGYRRGLIKTLAEFASTVLSSLIASLGGPIIAGGLYDSFVKEALINKIRSSLPDFTAATRTSEISKSILSDSPSYVRNSLEMLGIDAKSINEQVVKMGTDIPVTLESMVRPIILKVFTVIVTIVLFIIVVMIVSIAAKALTKTIDVTGLKTVNKVIGAFIGAAEAVVLLMVISLIFYLLTVMLPTDLAQGLRDNIDSTYIYKIIFYIDYPDTIINSLLNL